MVKYNPNLVILSEDENQNITIKKKHGCVFLITGKKGSGKTYLSGIISDQFENVIYLDPVVGGAFKQTISEICGVNGWKVWRVSDDHKKDVLKLNISECGRKVVESIFYKIPKRTELKQKNALTNFFKQPKELKNWKSFEVMCQDNKLDMYLPEFEKLFSKKDEGVSIKDLQHGKHIIEMQNIDPQTLTMGIFFNMLIEQRGLDKKIDYFGKDFLLMCVDEGQEYARMGTSLGNSLSKAGEQYRKFGIGLMVSGSNYSGINSGFHPGLRRQKDYLCIFKTEGNIVPYKKDGIDIIEDDWVELREYWFFLYNSFEMAMSRHPIKASKFYLQRREQVRLSNRVKSERVVVKHNVSNNDYLVQLNSKSFLS